VFKPVLDELIVQNHDFVYLSADPDDPGLNFLKEKGIEAHCLGHMNAAIVQLNRLKADVIVMTTPQLEVVQLKRSKDVRHYCHLIHAPIDIHTYKKFAFDHYDSVLCSSTFQMENLRQLEQDRNRPAKKLLETGCTYYDLKSPETDNSQRDALLLAPTWGEKSFLAQGGIEVIKELLSLDYPLIFRPHPQSWISDKELLDTLVETFQDNPHFILDSSPDNGPSLKRAKIMVCDFSGVIYDFILLQQQPVIAVERNWKDGGYESSDLTNKQSTYALLEKAGEVLPFSEIEHLPEAVERALSKKVAPGLSDPFIFNFGKAGKIAAEQIRGL